jgi:hypothetical protein
VVDTGNAILRIQPAENEKIGRMLKLSLLSDE